jgi:hypothetical protein
MLVVYVKGHELAAEVTRILCLDAIVEHTWVPSSARPTVGSRKAEDKDTGLNIVHG